MKIALRNKGEVSTEDWDSVIVDNEAWMTYPGREVPTNERAAVHPVMLEYFGALFKEMQKVSNQLSAIRKELEMLKNDAGNNFDGYKILEQTWRPVANETD